MVAGFDRVDEDPFEPLLSFREMMPFRVNGLNSSMAEWTSVRNFVQMIKGALPCRVVKENINRGQ